MSQSYSKKYTMPHLNGFAAAAVLVVAALFIAWRAFSVLENGVAGVSILLLPLGYCFTRFRVVQPNTALVGTLFGKYAGVLPKSGFFWLFPFYSTVSVSLKTSNYVTATLKVNDASGTHDFLQVQSEGALRVLATHHPYTNDGTADSLTGHSDKILEQFRRMVQERVEIAGISIDETRFTHLAYAPEIAQAMLRRQQAEAVILARQTLVRGAIGMVAGTVAELEKRGIVNMTEPEKAKLVTNMMTVLLSEENASPVLNVSGD